MVASLINNLNVLDKETDSLTSIIYHPSVLRQPMHAKNNVKWSMGIMIKLAKNRQPLISMRTKLHKKNSL